MVRYQKKKIIARIIKSSPAKKMKPAKAPAIMPISALKMSVDTAAVEAVDLEETKNLFIKGKKTPPLNQKRRILNPLLLERRQ